MSDLTNSKKMSKKSIAINIRTKDDLRIPSFDGPYHVNIRLEKRLIPNIFSSSRNNGDYVREYLDSIISIENDLHPYLLSLGNQLESLDIPSALNPFFLTFLKMYPIKCINIILGDSNIETFYREIPNLPLLRELRIDFLQNIEPISARVIAESKITSLKLTGFINEKFLETGFGPNLKHLHITSSFPRLIRLEDYLQWSQLEHLACYGSVRFNDVPYSNELRILEINQSELENVRIRNLKELWLTGYIYSKLEAMIPFLANFPKLHTLRIMDYDGLTTAAHMLFPVFEQKTSIRRLCARKEEICSLNVRIITLFVALTTHHHHHNNNSRIPSDLVRELGRYI